MRSCYFLILPLLASLSFHIYPVIITGNISDNDYVEYGKNHIFQSVGYLELTCIGQNRKINQHKVSFTKCSAVLIDRYTALTSYECVNYTFLKEGAS